MGLDMYLTAKWFIDYSDKDKTRDSLWGVEDLRGKKVESIRVEAGYWRKANAIHKWLIDTCASGDDDCREFEVSREQLKRLLCITKEVLKDNIKAAKLLPTGDGFFFGSTAYDECYYGDLKSTVKILEECLDEKEYPAKWCFCYEASW